MKSIIILLSFFVLFSCNNKGTDPKPESTEETLLIETVQYRAIEGVDENLLSLDIYYTDNKSDNRPVVIWVHGGAWAIGDKANNIDDKVKLFQSNEWLFVSINYRLSPVPYEFANPNRIKYPTHNRDVAQAIKWIYENIDQYGGNPNKLALLGHSAGAHLVSLTGTRKEFLEFVEVPISAIKGVASIDTEGYDVRKKVEEQNDYYINAFGDDETENREASPLFNVPINPPFPNFFIAKRGSIGRIEVANHFISALESNQVSVDQVDGSIYTHSEINEAIGEEGETLITNSLITFLKKCFE